jgi:hypothetical protein
MKRTIALTSLLCGGALLLGTTRNPNPEHPNAPWAVECSDGGCEPGGVVEIELLGSRVRNGVLEFTYTMTPRLDGAALEATVDPRGGALLAGGRTTAGAVTRGEKYVGDVRVRLQNGAAGGRVIVTAALAFPATDENGPTGAIETQSTQLAVDWGNTMTIVDGAREVTSGDVVSLDLPAIREGGR